MAISSNSASQNWNELNALARTVQNEQEVKVVKDSTGTRVVILDKDGLRTTEPGAGIDVVSATNDQLTFNSANNTFKIVTTGTASGSLTLPSYGASVQGENIVTILDLAHSLSFIPAVMIFLESSGSYFPISHGSLYISSMGINSWATTYFEVLINTSQVLVNVKRSYAANASGSISSFGPVTLNLRYYILQETAN